MKTNRLAVIGLLTGLAAVGANHAANGNPAPKYFVEGIVQDKARDLDTHHIMTPPSTLGQWQTRRAEIKQQILFSAGLFPFPDKTPLNAKVTSKYELPDLTIWNVVLESRPGFYLCGNLYVPKGKKGPFPAIVNPHGHWVNGRLEMQPDVPKADPAGKMGAGRGNLVSIGINLARHGMICFAYDAVGYNDTNQVEHMTFTKDLKPWLWGVSEMGLQIWNSIRVTDYLESLSIVDKSRIGATGASGGGSQTFLLTAVDERIKVAVPVNMVSAYMQGGCLCENGPGLRVGTDNVEVAAVMAPRPLLLVAATGDWSSKNPTEEWPTIKKVYDLYGAGDKTAVHQFNYQHNYNVESREAMAAWFGKWFQNDNNAEHYRETPFTVDLTKMRAWSVKNPMPSNALKEEALIRSMEEEASTRLTSYLPQNRIGLDSFRATYGAALKQSLFVTTPTGHTIGTRGGSKTAVIVTDSANKMKASELERNLQAGGYAKVETFVVGTGPKINLWNAFFTCYNRTPLGDNVQHVVNAAAEYKATGSNRTDIIGLGDGAPVALLGAALVPGGLKSGRAVVDLAGLPTDDNGYIEKSYAPGLRRTGDFKTAAILTSPSRLMFFNRNAGFSMDTVGSSIKAVGGDLNQSETNASAMEIGKWLRSK